MLLVDSAPKARRKRKRRKPADSAGEAQPE
jgi:hypothetical protein